MRFLFFLIFFITSNCYAGGLMPDIESAPIVVSIVEPSDPKAKQAIQASQKAFLRQSGLSSDYGLLVDFVKKKEKKYSKLIEGELGYFIDEYTFLNSKHVFFLAGTTYVLIVKKEFTQRFRNPIIPSVSQYVTVGTKMVSTGIEWKF